MRVTTKKGQLFGEKSAPPKKILAPPMVTSEAVAEEVRSRLALLIGINWHCVISVSYLFIVYFCMYVFSFSSMLPLLGE